MYVGLHVSPIVRCHFSWIPYKHGKSHEAEPLYRRALKYDEAKHCIAGHWNMTKQSSVSPFFFPGFINQKSRLQKMPLVALIIVVPFQMKTDVTTSSYEGFKLSVCLLYTSPSPRD